MSVTTIDPTLQAAQSRLESQVATLTAEMARLRHNGHRPRRRRLARLLPAALLALLAAFAPLALWAANFQDLHPGSGHNANINAIADAGITRGCFDTAHYCPNDFVTREQMASFLARTAGLGNNPPVANALTAVIAQAAETATEAQTADLALTVPDDSVTADKLSAAGSTPGQVLTATSDGVAWQPIVGQQGPPGVSGFQIVPFVQPIPGANEWTLDVACPNEKVALVGGYTLPASAPLIESRPRTDVGDNGRVWRWTFITHGPASPTFYLVCATANP